MELGPAIVWIVIGYFAIVLLNTAWVWWRGPGDAGGEPQEPGGQP